MSLKVGVLAIQGDVHENISSAELALAELGMPGAVSGVKTPAEISRLDCLIMPGGESTTVGRLSMAAGLLDAVRERVLAGMPVLGICAGLIMLSNTVHDRVLGKTDQPLLELLDVTLERNSFGRQRESFEASISMEAIGIPRFNGVFIRAPSISAAGPGIEILARLGKSIVAVKKDHIIGTAFHPELTTDLSLHKYLISMAGTAD